MSESRYKNEWKENSLNQEFWEEVLVGRTIDELIFDDNGLTAIVLDDRQVIYLKHEDVSKGVIYIKD